MRFMHRGVQPAEGLAEHDRILTVPNIFTAARFLITPLFVWLVLAQEQYAWGVAVLVVMGSTDWVDGYLARRLGQGSWLGRILDPLADRITLITVAVTIVIAGIAPWWLLGVLVLPDVILVVTSLLLFHWHPDLPVSLVGKLRTAALLVGTPLLLLARAISVEPNLLTWIAWVFISVGIVGHLVAAYQYFWAILGKYKAIRLTHASSQGR